MPVLWERQDQRVTLDPQGLKGMPVLQDLLAFLDHLDLQETQAVPVIKASQENEVF